MVFHGQGEMYAFPIKKGRLTGIRYRKDSPEKINMYEKITAVYFCIFFVHSLIDFSFIRG